MTCPHCAAVVPEAARFCPGCGAGQSSASQLPTAVAGAGGTMRPALPMGPIGRRDASGSSVSAAFAAGQVLDGRYRIIGLLGRGGMGEVYRADDLTLGQPVSLKFLPRGMANTPGLLERFRAEVRHARHVSHPNVCRVYDIGEIDGQQFLTMEFVDGEDLGTLLRRIGHLPMTKANEVARQICAGLAAAHDKGVLHRDLKPSNIMIDGDGRVRITDFGLAVRSDEGATDFAGTPAYMSPEQFEGKPATERSDLYSLGLILYEVYTGHRPFEAATLAEWRSRHTQAEPTRPSQHGEPLDEVTERAILRCLEKDPAKRPVSALQLAAALPGGDPIAAALAAGEIPSPEMVAASGGEGALSPRTAWLMLIGVLVMLASILAVSQFSTDQGLAPMTRGPAALRERARQVLARFQLDRGAIDAADWFERDYDVLKYLAHGLPSVEWRRSLANWGSPVIFAYRQSPDYLRLQNWEGRVNAIAPPPVIPGMAQVTLNADGRLRGLAWQPPAYDSSATLDRAAPDWAALFGEAGLDYATFRPVEPRWVPPCAFDVRAEWAGPAPWATGVGLRVVGAGYHGKPCYFAVHGPWSKPLSSLGPAWSAGTWLTVNLMVALIAVLMLAGGYLAYRNVRLGRGDRRGAFRVGLFMLAVQLLAWALRTHYFPDVAPLIWNVSGQGLGPGLVLAVLSSSVYLALEPFLRRRMPELLVGWARLLEGRFGDPRVGRDLLIGALAGTAAAATSHATSAATSWITTRGETSMPPDTDMLYGGALALSGLLRTLQAAVQGALLLFGLLFALRLLFRNPRVALVALVIVMIPLALGGENAAVELPSAIAISVLCGACIGRGGLLAVVSFAFFWNVLYRLPLPLGRGAPYTASSLMILLVLLGIALHAFRRSLGARLGFGRALADEWG